MSAREYVNCPRCRELRKQLREQRFAEANAAYGKLSQLEFEEMLRAANLTNPILGTLGEYHEWEFTSTGKWWMRYSCACSDCGFEFSHNAEVPYRLNLPTA